MDHPLYLDPSQPLDLRLDDLLSRLTLEEKVSQTLFAAPAIERLGIPPYNWWNECLHGVARAGVATVFPQAIGLAAAWDVELISQVATVISDEARAKYHEALRHGLHAQYYGLTYWSPNINIFRDPRWGRGQETYGEDPYLTSRLGVAFVKGLQGDDPDYLKLVATPKHFAVHSGPEMDRHQFDAQVDLHDLWETYLPAFEACVKEGQAASIMGAYNRTNGEACCASPTLLEDILRSEWEFPGFVVSDCGAIDDIYRTHHLAASAAEAAAAAVQAGCDLNCGFTYTALTDAVRSGLIDEQTITRSVRRLFQARFRLGMFDPPEKVTYAQIPPDVIDSPAHRQLALQAARESIVLLKNQGDLLPLKRQIKTLAVIGPNADNPQVLLGNYFGTPSRSVTFLEGIRTIVGRQMTLLSSPGCLLVEDGSTSSLSLVQEALELARQAEAVVFVGGLSQLLEGEEGQEEGAGAGRRSKGDRTDLNLPGVQQKLLEAISATGVPVVLVLVNGSALSIGWAREHIPAILEAWYPGEEGGTALAEVLFGEYNPGGRLPVTFYASVHDLPPFDDYCVEGRTYRYFHGEPLFPFGYGLSYTHFEYQDLQLSRKRLSTGEPLTVSVTVRNSGDRSGDEVVQLYLENLTAPPPTPIRQLAGFDRIHLEPGEARTVQFMVSPSQMARVNSQGERELTPTEFEISVGGRQPTPEDRLSNRPEVLFARFKLR